MVRKPGLGPLIRLGSCPSEVPCRRPRPKKISVTEVKPELRCKGNTHLNAKYTYNTYTNNRSFSQKNGPYVRWSDTTQIVLFSHQYNRSQKVTHYTDFQTHGMRMRSWRGLRGPGGSCLEEQAFGNILMSDFFRGLLENRCHLFKLWWIFDPREKGTEGIPAPGPPRHRRTVWEPSGGPPTRCRPPGGAARSSVADRWGEGRGSWERMQGGGSPEPSTHHLHPPDAS